MDCSFNRMGIINLVDNMPAMTFVKSPAAVVANNAVELGGSMPRCGDRCLGCSEQRATDAGASEREIDKDLSQISALPSGKATQPSAVPGADRRFTPTGYAVLEKSGGRLAAISGGSMEAWLSCQVRQ